MPAARGYREHLERLAAKWARRRSQDIEIHRLYKQHAADLRRIIERCESDNASQEAPR